jgi:LAO/AO transport system kinase
VPAERPSVRKGRNTEGSSASPDELADRVRNGDRRALARILTEVESRSAAGEAAVRRLYPDAGKAHLVGVTGAPGTGKSTLVAALIGEIRRAGRSVAVVAVDPSSPITGGAILGDRVRMQAHAGDPDVFVRSMASRGHSGGLAATSVAAAAVLDAAGFDVIILETVGAGQSGVEVAAAADTTVVVEAPGMGDEIQAIKAGLLEVADIVVVNKGDLPGALRAASQLRAMLSAAAPPVSDDRPRPKRPEVLVATAATGAGVPELMTAIDRHAAELRAQGDDRARLARAEAQLDAALADRFREQLHGPQRRAASETLLRDIAAHTLDPYAAADRLLALLRE